MNIFGGCSPLWVITASGCGLFAGGCNVFRDGYHYYEYAEIVGSRIIIGYILMQLVLTVLVYSSQETVILVDIIVQLPAIMVLLLVYFSVKSLPKLLTLGLVL